MGKRGPAKEPLAVKIAKGTARAEDRESLSFSPGVPACPDWLDRFGDQARAKWDEVIAQLSEHPDLIAPVHQHALAAYCIAWQRIHDAQEEIARDGITCYSEKGAQYQHPAVGIQNKAIETVVRIGAKFGLTPSDQMGLPMGQGKKQEGVRRRNA